MPLGNFETHSQPGDNEQKEGGKEGIPNFSSWKERLKYHTKIAAVIGATSLFTVEDIGDINEQQYESHLDELLNQEKKGRLDSLFKKIRKEAGYRAVEQIKQGDKAAFSYEYPAESEPTAFNGFEDANINDELIKELLSEDFFFPENWIQGEIKEITYVDKVREKQGGIGIGRYTDTNNAIVFFRQKNTDLSKEARESLPWFYKYTFAHESAHANDWETDKDLNIIERAELLSSVLDRLDSDNAYQSPGPERQEGYYKNYLDGTRIGKRRAAQEYWAEICKTYFSNPEYLEDNHPKDFKLVDEYVRKQDPNFDPSESGGPYFDGQTGEMLPQWKEYIKKQIPDN